MGSNVVVFVPNINVPVQMAEAVGLAAGIIGIVVPALHGARLLLRDLEKITTVPDAMAKLKEDVASISASLVLLKDIDEPVWLSLGVGVEELRSSMRRHPQRSPALDQTFQRRYPIVARSGASW